ncbi:MULTISPECIES: helix-turn-helix transcriptional regulator [Niastella]|uniref:Helix-turn-helix transcriptional regulator n=1 Tax=Niastella soli TaxID=2821487 RepID=A0ABS3YZQ4_9BACT|nr:AraC family transcriptional regulator [Niastella soli]MBO9203407.1 helix-turn-helix transcriptional regulator [Niastella soli]
MLIRFPTSSKDIEDLDVLQLGNSPLARYRKATAAGKRTSFITEHTLIFVLHGHKYLHLEEQTHMAEAGHLVLLKRGIYALSEFVPDGLNYEALLLFFTDDFVKKFMHTHQLTTTQSPVTGAHLVVPTNELLNGFKTQFMGYFGKNLPGLESILQLKLQELMLLLLAGPQGQQVKTFFQSIAFGQPLEIDFIVRKHLFQPLSLDELAKLSGRSLASFKRDFQHQYNSAPKKWINEQRLDHARMLLLHSNKNVTEVAMECGFENIPHFIKIFKQKFGVTPNSVRGREVDQLTS